MAAVLRVASPCATCSRHGSGFSIADRCLLQCQRIPAGCVCHAEKKQPVSSKILTSIITTTDVPFSSYLAHPRTPMHYVDARIKQLWLFTILLIIPRSPWQIRLGLVAFVVATSMICLPARLWKAQMGRLAGLAAFLLVVTATTADPGMAAPLPRNPPADVAGLPPLDTLNTGYDYVLFKFLFVTVTRFSLSLGVSVGAIAFTALQVTSLFLVTTPPEEMALAFRWFASPLRIVGLPAKKLTMMLLLSLRFVSLVFDEVRNLCLGLAARSIHWEGLDRNGVVGIWIVLIVKLFNNLFSRSRFIAESLVARGYSGPDNHALNIPRLCASNAIANVIALSGLALLVGICSGKVMVL